MLLTISVTDSLASRLQCEADLHKISVEQFALDALGQVVKTQEWPRFNRRRLTLIQKQFANGLTAQETTELQELQRQADEHLESLDSPMLDDVATMEKAAAGVLNGATN